MLSNNSNSNSNNNSGTTPQTGSLGTITGGYAGNSLGALYGGSTFTTPNYNVTPNFSLNGSISHTNVTGKNTFGGGFGGCYRF